ncbi:MAG: hypothetical protein ABIS68_04020 [Casimicrobiaceae bacterium]
MISMIRLFAGFLVLAWLSVSAAHGATCTWSGNASANWSGLNWSCAAGPQSGDALVFPDTGSNKAMNDDIPDLSVASIAFPDNGGGYTLTGSGNLILTGGAAITSNANQINENTLALSNPIKFTAATAIIQVASSLNGQASLHGTLNLNGPLDLNGVTLSFVWNNTVPHTVVNGVISGAGAVSVDGIGGDYGLRFNASNTFTGPVTVNSGYVLTNHANALGASGSLANGTTVNPGGTLVLGADIGNEYLMLEGGGGTSGNGILQSSGFYTWSGPVMLNNGTTNNVNLINHSITFAGPVTGTGGFYCCNSLPGMIAFSNAGNTFSGASDFISFGGILRLLANGAYSPNSAVTLGGPDGGIVDMQSFSATIASLTGSPTSKLQITTGQTLTISGAVNLAGMNLAATVSGNPPVGTVFKIIDKTAAGAITGTFGGLAEGATFAAGPFELKISYVGGNGNDVTVTVQSSILSVVKPGSGFGIVTSNVGAINCGAICSDAYSSGTPIVLTATPDPTYMFTGWLGPCTGTGVCSFNMGTDTVVSATFAPNTIGTHILDVDANSQYDAITDGLMILRHLFGTKGSDLIADAVGPSPGRATAGAIGTYLTDVTPKFDIDGNGKADALTDGLLIIRYLFGLTGAPLINGAVGQGAIRTLAPDIQAQILGLKP